MLGAKAAPRARSRPGLARAVAKYEAKLAKAQNPTQHHYAAGMLRLAKAELADAETREPFAGGAGVVTLHEDEYEVG